MVVLHSPRASFFQRRRHTGRHSDDDHRASATGLRRIPQFTLNADETFPAAGLAKLPVAVEFLRRVDLGQFDLAERWDTSAEPRVGGSGVLDFLDPATR